MSLAPVLLRVVRAAAIAALAAACIPSERAAEPAGGAEQPKQGPNDSIRPLFGSWRVISVNDIEPSQPSMYLLFGDDWWQMQSQCVWKTGDWRVEGKRLDFAAIERRLPPPAPQGPAVVMCARGLLPAEQAVPQVLSGTGTYDVEGAALTVTSSQGTVVARRQTEPVANPFGYTSYSPDTTWGLWRIEAVDGVPIEDADYLVSNTMVTVRLGCAYYQWRQGLFGEDANAYRREPFAGGCGHEPSAAERKLFAIIESLEQARAQGQDERVLRSPAGAIRLVAPS